MSANYREIPGLLQSLSAFDGNSMSARKNSNDEYWVYSYSTPIALIDPQKDIYQLNARRYSTTTSRQQNIVRKVFPWIKEVPSARDLGK